MAPQEPNPLPKYKDLPFNKGDPAKSCWCWGKGDEMGRLNLLTPDRIKNAAHEEVKLGEKISLNWPLHYPDPPTFGRKVFGHKYIDKSPRYVFDDEIHINTQSGSQWDGFSHFADQGHGVFYNNVTKEDITSKKIKGMNAWNEAGGIAGRGVLLDVYAWYEKQGKAYDGMTAFAVPVDVLKQVAKEQGVTFQRGDLLFVRFGFTQAQYAASLEKRQAWGAAAPSSAPGLLQSNESEEWLFDNWFSAVATDSLAFEVYPTTVPPYMMHEAIIAGWGMPIGEMFDLEKLAKRCHELKRYSFFVSSSPLNVLGGIASPPNIQAIL